jgi:hypothetical protein
MDADGVVFGVRVAEGSGNELLLPMNRMFIAVAGIKFRAQSQTRNQDAVTEPYKWRDIGEIDGISLGRSRSFLT